MFYASIHFQKHIDKFKTFKTEQEARRWLDLEAAITDNVKDYILYFMPTKPGENWRLVDSWSC